MEGKRPTIAPLLVRGMDIVFFFNQVETILTREHFDQIGSTKRAGTRRIQSARRLIASEKNHLFACTPFRRIQCTRVRSMYTRIRHTVRPVVPQIIVLRT